MVRVHSYTDKKKMLTSWSVPKWRKDGNCFNNDQKYPEQTLPSFLRHTKQQLKWSVEKHKNETLHSFQYTQNNVAQPDCINHLLKKYLLFIVYEQVERVPSKCSLPSSPLCTGNAPAWLGSAAPLFSHICLQLQQDLDENRFLSKYYLMPGSVIKTLLGSYPTT